MTPTRRFIIISIGRDIVSSAETVFQRKADEVVNVGELSTDQFGTIRASVYQCFQRHAAYPIDLVLSGPVALSFTLGQIIGLNHFDITVFHYNSAQREYQAVSPPHRSEIT